MNTSEWTEQDFRAQEKAEIAREREDARIQAEVNQAAKAQYVRSEQVYNALSVAATRMGQNNYLAGKAAHIKAGRKASTYRYTPTPEHDAVVKAMVDLTMSDEECMALLHEHNVMKQRLGE
jgi:DNA-binding protein H-NS